MSVKYPDTTDPNFGKKISKIFSKYEMPKKKKSFNEYCFPKEYELQLPQKFVAKYMGTSTPYSGVLIYHRIGAGKTCTAIQIGEHWKHERKIIVVLPASLKGNFRDELRSQCAGDIYLTHSERNHLKTLHPSSGEYKSILKKSDKIIDSFYTIYSYNKFIELAQDGKISLKKAVLIIDEIQNMISETGTYYNTLYDLILDAPKDLKVVLMSATPMFDKPDEIAMTLNLLRPKYPLPTNKAFYEKFVRTTKHDNDGIISYHHHAVNINYFKKCVRGYVSYFRGAPTHVFPEMHVRYVKCEMSDFQHNAYIEVLKNEGKEFNINDNNISSIKNLPNNFFIGTRMVSNIVFPNKKIGESGYVSFTNKLIMKNLEVYSTKFQKIIYKLKKKGKAFMYSGFKEYGGLKSFVKVLEAHGYKNYIGNGPGKKRFAIWSGDETVQTKDELKNVYNREDNILGNKLKLILGSPSIKEGVSLLAVRQVHILEPYWNSSRLDQIIGRASRFCSHKQLPTDDRKVTVYVYLATHPSENRSIDQYMHELSNSKNKLVQQFETAIRETAIDCELNKNYNFNSNEHMHCD
jgi:superfamily II DNA or RNA helicase